MSRLARITLAVALLTTAGGCSSDSTSPPPPSGVASVTVTPPAATLTVGGSVTLTATTRDGEGEVLTDRPVTWSSSNSTVAPVSGTGVVSAVSPGGPVTITATSEGKSGTTQITVVAVAVARVDVTPPTSTLDAGTTLQLTATPRDADGDALPINVTTWSTSNEAVATVSSTGLVTAVGAGGPVTITAYAGTASGTATVTVVQPIVAAVQLSVGGDHACIVRADESAACWGSNLSGRLGDGGTSVRLVPTTVSGAHHFRELFVGGVTTCGILTDTKTYCWGDGGSGNLGNGGTADATVPAVVTAVAEPFTRVAPSRYYRATCALVASGGIYCWGSDPTGILTGQTSVTTPTLLPVGPTTPPITKLTVGDTFGCGLSATGVAYCWGVNALGQLGDGGTSLHTAPVPVVGGHIFLQVASGRDHTCGVVIGSATLIAGGANAAATGGPIRCWGSNTRGQLGDGTTTRRSTPVQAGTITDFIAVAVGAETSCGLRANGSAWCWGLNSDGQLGDQTTINRSTPVAVTGGQVFTALGVGTGFACGLSANGVYCWGENATGQLGDGTTTNRAVPTKVSGT